MRRFCICRSRVFLPAIFLTVFAFGQDFPKAQVFGGYSYLHVGTEGVTTSTLNNECTVVFGGTCPISFGIHSGFNGWNVAPQANVNRWFGVKAQISGQYGNVLSIKFTSSPPIIPFSVPGQHIYDFLFGPVISHRADKYTAFFHGLLGAEHVGFSGNIPVGTIRDISGPSETDFAFALGGGLDVKVCKALRDSCRDSSIIEFVNSSGGGHQNDFRFSAGVVFRLGGEN